MGEQEANSRFRILCCVDGSDESYRGIRYAVRMGQGTDADIFLLYVRPVDQGLRTGGMQISVARQNMLEWGLELPGIKHLKRARDLLIELGVMGDDWEKNIIHTDIAGDPLGDNLVEYLSSEGKRITMKLMVSPTVTGGILDQCEVGQYNVTILGASEKWRSRSVAGFLESSVAETVANEAPGSVLVARELEENHGHLICVDDSEKALQTARQDALLASRCACPISLLSVAPDASKEAWAQANIDRAAAALKDMGINVSEAYTLIGDPVKKICEAGERYSIVVVSASDKRGFRRFVRNTVDYQVMAQANCSVMIARTLPLIESY